MDKQALQILWDKWMEGTADLNEQETLLAAMHEPADAAVLREICEQDGKDYPVMEQLDAETTAQVRLALLAVIRKDTENPVAIKPVHRVHFIGRFKWIAAAVILFAFAGGVWFWFSQGKKQDTQTFASVYKNDVAPGKAGGKLKLSSGQLLTIDSLKEGFIVSDAGLKLYKENGKIVYKGTATETAYNEIIEDIGRYTSVELPDHSIAWVNSGSSIRYPLHFADDERKITMTGEAAFQVVHNEKQPFRVYANDQVFEDKGTVFNIRAYKDEPVIRTTVLEGLVSFGNTLIKPMQQGIVTKDGQLKIADNVNTKEVFAWRDGKFTFGDASIEEIMKDAAKWYGVEVVYQDSIDGRFGFVGIDRNMPLSNLLHNLETIGGVHFEIDGKKVTVKK